MSYINGIVLSEVVTRYLNSVLWTVKLIECSTMNAAIKLIALTAVLAAAIPGGRSQGRDPCNVSRTHLGRLKFKPLFAIARQQGMAKPFENEL